MAQSFHLVSHQAIFCTCPWVFLLLFFYFPSKTDKQNSQVSAQAAFWLQLPSLSHLNGTQMNRWISNPRIEWHLIKNTICLTLLWCFLFLSYTTQSKRAQIVDITEYSRNEILNDFGRNVTFMLGSMTHYKAVCHCNQSPDMKVIGLHIHCHFPSQA